MRRLLNILIPLLCLAAFITLAAAWLIERATAEWFYRDVQIRSSLAINSARQSIVVAWSDPDGLLEVLEDVTRDVRIESAAACDENFQPIVFTREYDEQLSCDRLPKLMHGSPLDKVWNQISRLNESDVHISVHPITDGDRRLGFVAVVHDLSYVQKRSEIARSFSVIFLGGLLIALAAAVAWFFGFTWRRWTAELLSFLRLGKGSDNKFAPILGDVREWMARLSRENDVEQNRGTTWTPQRLKQFLETELVQERLIVVANREPYIHVKDKAGNTAVNHPASGLVTALEPVLRACSGVWVAHGSGNADKENSDKKGRLRVPPHAPAYGLRRVWLSKEDEQGYYYGFANGGLWPLCHIAHVRPLFRKQDFEKYREINQRFADAIVEEAESDDPIVLVQDYHFALLPALLRARLPRATIVTFWHIPWMEAERFGICPWPDEVLRGLLGSSIVSFHTQGHCNNFIASVQRFLEARIDREDQAVVLSGQRTLVRSYPISIDWPPEWLATMPAMEECRKEVFGKLGLTPGHLMGIGVDRIDYTKGIEERFLAVERMLELHPELVGKFSFVQIGAPSRTELTAYKAIGEAVLTTADRINTRFGKGSYLPIVLLAEHHEPEQVYRHYRAANVCYVSSLDDGMNLVAKEFVASRQDEKGVLVLSRFTGAARELRSALIVNPYDIDGSAEALYQALIMGDAEQTERMRAMRDVVSAQNVYRWAGRMLMDAARVRSDERLRARLQRGEVA